MVTELILAGKALEEAIKFDVAARKPAAIVAGLKLSHRDLHEVLGAGLLGHERSHCFCRLARRRD